MNFVSIPVHLYRAMPAFSVGSVSFEPAAVNGENGVGTLTVATEEALTHDQARMLLETVIATIQLVAKGQIDADYSRMYLNVSNNGKRHVSVDLPAAATMVGHPYTKDELDSLQLALRTIASRDFDVDADRLELSLRWIRMATVENDVLQRFVMSWIALEALYRLDDSESSNTRGIHQRIETLYHDPSFVKKTSTRIRQIYELRNDVFHRADLGGTKVSQAANDTIALLRDCLRAELRLQPTLNTGMTNG